MDTLFLAAIVIVLIILVVCLIGKRKKNDKTAPHTELTKNEEPAEEPKAEATKEESKPEEPKDEDDEDILIPKNDHLVADLHRVFEEEKIFLQPDIHIDDVAKMLLTNRTYVTRLMRQEYGLSFIEYVNIARIQHSQSLLYSSNMTLDEIAERSGFQSTSNYCRAFKRYIGTSPLAWKNSLPQT